MDAPRYPARIRTFAHGGVEVDHVEDGIVAEAFEEAENVVHGKGESASANELHGFTVLQVDTGNDHVFAFAERFTFIRLRLNS